MIEIDIPGTGAVRIECLVLDYNGTLAVDGALLDGVADALRVLAASVEIHVVTADTFGKAAAALHGLPLRLVVLPADRQDVAKLDYVTKLGCGRVAAVGNGRNDRLMLEAAALGVALVQAEGAAVGTLLAADVACTGILDALDLLRRPGRLVATLRR